MKKELAALWAFFQSFVAKFGKAAGTAQPPVEFDAGVIEEGKFVYCYVRFGAFIVKERVPLDIKKWDEERQQEYLGQVSKRLTKKLARTMNPDLNVRDMNRKERRAKVKRLKI